MNGEHIFDLIPAYALGCLDPQEKNRVEIHLAQCAICREEWTSYQAVVVNLALSPPQLNPPRHLRESIIKAAELSQSRVPFRPSARLPEAAPAQKRSLVPSWVRTFLPIWGIASFLLVLGLGLGNLLLWQQVKTVSQPGKISFSEYQIIPLNGTSSAPDATGIFVISEGGLAGSLNVDGLKPLDLAHQYQLWLIDVGRRTNGGVFSVNRLGYGSLKVNSSRPLIEYNGFGITIEPAGGSPGPTGDKVLGGNL